MYVRNTCTACTARYENIDAREHEYQKYENKNTRGMKEGGNT